MSALMMLAQMITFSACVALVCIVEPALNRCTRQTRPSVFGALFLIAAGAVLLAASLIPDFGLPCWLGTAALAAGAALILRNCQRRSVWP